MEMKPLKRRSINNSGEMLLLNVTVVAMHGRVWRKEREGRNDQIINSKSCLFMALLFVYGNGVLWV